MAERVTFRFASAVPLGHASGTAFGRVFGAEPLCFSIPVWIVRSTRELSAAPFAKMAHTTHPQMKIVNCKESVQSEAAAPRDNLSSSRFRALTQYQR